MLQDPGRSRVIACHSREIGNILLDYYHLENYENGGKENGDRAGIWFGYWSVRSCVAVDTGHSLVTLFFPIWSVKDRSLHMTLGRSQTYYPKHILVYGHLEDLLLSCRGSGSFRTDCQGFILVEEVLALH